MSFVLLGILNSQAASGGAGEFFFGQLDGLGFDQGYGIATDSSNNFFISGFERPDGQTYENAVIAKYDASGNLQSQRRLVDSNDGLFHLTGVDANDNAYLAYLDQNISNVVLAKYDNDLILQFQKEISSAEAIELYGVYASSTNVYMAGVEQNDSKFYVQKVNDSGVIQWTRTLNGADNESMNEYQHIVTDSSDNVYICGLTFSEGASGDSVLAKYDSSGNLVWQRLFGGAGREVATSVTVDSNDDVYIAGYTVFGGEGFLAKFNSSGTLQWQKQLAAGSKVELYTVATDSENNLYVAGLSDTVPLGGSLVVKYDSSGNLVWQRTVQIAGGSLVYGITVDSTDSILVNGWHGSGDGTFAFFFNRLPKDGSLTGTYSLDGENVIYASSSLTSSTSTFSSSASTLTSASVSFSITTASKTEEASSLTSTIVEI